MDISDAFDSIAQWEEQLIDEGEQMGHEQGKALGIEEGKELGIIKGTEIGSEIGFYCGCYLTWKSMVESETLKHKISDRVAKSIVSFGALVQSFPLKNIVDEDIMHQLLSIRAKFKVITSLLGLQGSLVFNPDDVYAHKNMSF